MLNEYKQQVVDEEKKRLQIQMDLITVKEEVRQATMEYDSLYDKQQSFKGVNLMNEDDF